MSAESPILLKVFICAVAMAEVTQFHRLDTKLVLLFYFSCATSIRSFTFFGSMRVRVKALRHLLLSFKPLALFLIDRLRLQC